MLWNCLLQHTVMFSTIYSSSRGQKQKGLNVRVTNEKFILLISVLLSSFIFPMKHKP